ncbi:tripartite tricarboxylate transporter permease [Sulfitobacter mediterraneus]|uniref:tripartite tricarboxylate transporter permease n=1 Tax=Sulfitobacter mediterraneus TaxID=83219 RepID=UPI0021A3527D|nr:tripartite tricarboxylate transporter permease [Sulfitobacter mediterraneus]UWR13430.1 tripartite tricarboxylate transporter permease [Sulfitobacter mediterraneus]
MTIDAFFQGLSLVLQWPTFGFLLLGVVLGIWLGAVPGLGGPLGLVLILPFTYNMEMMSAFAILLGVFAVTSTSDTIASVMLGIPGTAASQATVLDGHPLARKGEAARALGAAFTVSAFGGIFGALMLAISLPVALPIIMRFNNPELFALGLLGLIMVGSLSGTSLVKGLAAAAFGLLLSSFGYAADAAIPRYWLNAPYLLESLPLIPVVLGIFAIPELIDLAVRNTSISDVRPVTGGWRMLRRGIRDAFANWGLALRCSAIGVYIGMIPGIGGAVVDWIAYSHALQSSKDTENFGNGDIRGVIAPEAANNAVRGGSLIPTVAFGVPGSAMNALLLSALLIQGLQPGTQMLTTQLPVTFALVWDIALANIAAAGLLMLLANPIARLSFVSGHLIVPGVLLFVFMGAWLTTADLGDWVTLMVFGVLGYMMKLGDWPRPPVVLAFILGGMMENSFLLSWKIHQGLGWLDRPIVLAIFALIVMAFVMSARRSRKKRSGQMAVAKQLAEKTGPTQAAPVEVGDKLVSLSVAAIMVLVFVAALIPTVGWPTLVAAFPLIAIVPGIGLSVLALVGDARPAPDFRALAATTFSNLETKRALRLLGYCAAMILAAFVVGQKIALVALVVLYLRRWGKYGWPVAALYGAVSWVILVGFFDRVVHVFWMQPMIATPIRAFLPDSFPIWLFL